MTLAEFKSDKQLVSWCQTLFSTDQFKLLMEVMRESHPKNFRARGEHLGDNAHYKLGRIDGYDEFENNLLSAGRHEVPAPQEMPATYQPELTEVADKPEK